MGWEAAWRPAQARAHWLLGASRHSQWCCRPGIIPDPTSSTWGSAASPPWSPWGKAASTWPTSPTNSASSNNWWSSMDSYPFWVAAAAAAAGAGRGWPGWGPAWSCGRDGFQALVKHFAGEGNGGFLSTKDPCWIYCQWNNVNVVDSKQFQNILPFGNLCFIALWLYCWTFPHDI